MFDVKTGLFSIAGLFMKAFVIDSVIESINLCKYFHIVTDESEAICSFILNELHHGCTVVDGQGAYSGKDHKVVLAACRRGEAAALRKKIRELDPHAFLFITNTSEILGKGFRSV